MKFFPFFGASRSIWVSLPSEIFQALNGRSCLPIFEVDRKTVQTHRARIYPLGQPTASLSFSAWRLAHALKKADCARWPSPHSLWLETTGFLLENMQLFDWSSGNLRLKSGMSRYYADNTRASVAGRIAQGMALLFLEDKGYGYAGSFQSMIGEVSGRGQMTPDFVVENDAGERALVEAKGGFVSIGGRPRIKDRLKRALAQLNSGFALMNSQPVNSFAVGTFLREADDCSGEQSLVAFTELPPARPGVRVRSLDEAVRRGNYASWLSAMGFHESARRLWMSSGEPMERLVWTITLGGYRYVVAIRSIRPLYRRAPIESEVVDYWGNLPQSSILPPSDGVVLGVVGLDLEVIKKLGAAMRSRSQADGLLALELVKRQDPSSEIEGGEFNGSISSDSSLLGEIIAPNGKWPHFGWEVIEL